MLPLSWVWAMEAGAFAQFAHQYSVIVIKEGPADDAKRVGLPVQKFGRTAVVSLTGPMLKSPPSWMQKYGITGTRPVQMALQAAIGDKGIDRIVLRVDSPGGTVDGLAELADTVFTAKQSKPVIAQVDGCACSAAYYVSSQASQIYAGRMDLVGSIGCRLMMYDFSRHYENAGVKAIPIDTGKYKSAGAEGTPITEEQQADFQRIVDAYYADFLAVIVRGRGMTDAAVRQVGDGRMFTSAEALQLGLIDKVQPIEQTLAEAERPTGKPRLTKMRAKIELAGF